MQYRKRRISSNSVLQMLKMMAVSHYVPDNDKLRKFQRHWDEAGGDASSPEACYNDCVKLVRQIFHVPLMDRSSQLTDSVSIDRRLEKKRSSSITSPKSKKFYTRMR